MNWRSQLRNALMENFSESDIKAVCFDLGLDYEDLSGEGKTEKIISLMDYFIRTDDITRLISECSRYRPNVPWNEIAEAALEDNPPSPVSLSQYYSTRRSRLGQRSRIIAVATIVIVLVLVGTLVAYRLFEFQNDGATITPETNVAQIIETEIYASVSPITPASVDLDQTSSPTSPQPTAQNETRTPTSVPVVIESTTSSPAPIMPSTANPAELPDEPNWVLIFDYRFAPGFWSIGNHQYTIEADCPNFNDYSGNWTNTFQVSEDANLLPGMLYMRFAGVMQESIGAAPTVEEIHPEQETALWFGYIGLSYDIANQLGDECTVLGSWDGGEKALMGARTPYYEEP